MGVSVSKSKVDTMLEDIFSYDSFQKCQTVTVKNKQQVGDIVIEEGCDASIQLTQDTFIDDQCSLDSVVKSMQEYYVKNKADIEKGFVPNLVSVSTTESDQNIRQEVSTKIRAMCSDIKVDDEQVVGNVYCRGGKLNLPLMQKFYGKTACVVNQLLQRADKWKAENEMDLNESSGVGGFFSKWLNVQVIAIVIIAILFLAILYWMSVPGNAENAAKVAAVLI